MDIDCSKPPTFEENCQYILGIISAWGDIADKWYPLDFSYIGRRCQWRYNEWYDALTHLIRTGWIKVRSDGNLVVMR